MFDSTPFPWHGLGTRRRHAASIPTYSTLAIGDGQDIQLDGLGSRNGRLIPNQREVLLAVAMPRDPICPDPAVANT